MRTPIRWQGGLDGALCLLDQTLLPAQDKVLEIRTLEPVVDAIRRLAVRGAPAIGVAAAYGVFLGVRERAPADPAKFLEALDSVAQILRGARPTAINLAWAVERMRIRGNSEPTLQALHGEAVSIHAEDQELCRRIGDHGADLIEPGMTVLTHCNAGRLATAGDGTALSVLFTAWKNGTRFRVLADETRPLLQGSRLTALELADEGIPVEVVADSAAAGLIARGAVNLVITGADRIAANGDVANKVGTYGLALATRAHQVPMFVAAPTSTFDLSIPDGSHIPIENRDPEEVLSMGDHRVAAAGVGARNPAFDITPAGYLTGLITDRGLIQPVTTAGIKELLGDGR
jgi:methylthioribose-1-phosphate isomerase